MSDPRVEQIKQALIGGQSGGGLHDIRVYMGPCRQYGQGFGDFIRNIFRAVTPVIMRVGKTLFRTSTESVKEGSLIGDLFKSALKPKICTAFKHGGKSLGKLIQEQEAPAAAPPVEPPLLHQDERDVDTEIPPKPQTGSGRYKASRKHKLKNRCVEIKRFNVHYNF